MIERIHLRRLRVFYKWRMTRDPRLWSWLLILDAALHQLEGST
jgi:hypothetical protein